MVRVTFQRAAWRQRREAALVIGLLMLVTSAFAQSTGAVKGKVVDKDAKPVEGAKISMEYQGGFKRHLETKTNKKGEFVQIGLQPGNYKITAEKEGLGSQSFDAVVRLGQTAEVGFQLVPGQTAGGPGGPDIVAIKKLFEEGVAASRAEKHDDAIAKFKEAAVIVPNCYECYYNIGYAHMQKKEYGEAEAAYKKATEIKPDYVDAYNGLVSLYNAQRKFQEAQAASVEAAKYAAGAPGGGSPTALYNRAVVLWNQNNAAEAKKVLEEAIKVDPNHAESHYLLAKANLNLGMIPEAVTEFEAYLKVAPTGPYADEVKGYLSQLKKN